MANVFFALAFLFATLAVFGGIMALYYGGFRWR